MYLDAASKSKKTADLLSLKILEDTMWTFKFVDMHKIANARTLKLTRKKKSK